MKILALETTGARLGVCLWEDFKPKASKVEVDAKSYSHRLMPVMHDLFKKAKWKPQDLDAVAVDVGPGRFTGLRIGVAAARTLGQALDKPVIEVSSLEALAAQSSGWEAGKHFSWRFPSDLLCVLSDALRDDVYMGVWRFHRLLAKNRGGGTVKAYSHVRSPLQAGPRAHALPLRPVPRFLQELLPGPDLGLHGLRRPAAQSGAVQGLRVAGQVRGRRLGPGPGVGGRPGLREVLPAGHEALRNQVKPLYLRPSYAEESAKPKVPVAV